MRSNRVECTRYQTSSFKGNGKNAARMFSLGKTFAQRESCRSPAEDVMKEPQGAQYSLMKTSDEAGI